METREFGTRLRELRKRASLSQRVLANKVGIDFTYLSKIESGAMPPPSQQVILRLTEVLDADKDELMLLAGKIPSDIVQILKNEKVLQLLRSERTKKKIRGREAIKNNKKERVSTMKKLISYKSLSRIAISIVLVCAVAVLLWFASPVTDTAAASNSQGIFYNEKGEYEKAVVAFTKAIELDPSFALAYSNRGWVHIKLGEYEQAITDCSKAIELNPSLASAYNSRGWAYTELGQYEQAINDYNKAIELDPGFQK